MEKYFKRVLNQPSPSQNVSGGEVPSSSKRKATSDQPSPSKIVNTRKIQCSSKIPLLDVDFDNLPSDPALRVQISDYHSNIRDQVRRAYLLKGPCQPLKHDFPQTIISGEKRRFKPHWFDEGGGWLEYSIMKDAAFCFHCYLFRPSGLQGGSDSFTVDGFRNWKQKKKKFGLHVGGPNSAHNQAYRRAQDLINQKQHIETISYPLVYLLMTLALTLPVATATVERAFSSMRIVKGRLRNKMGDEWLNDSLVTYIENEVFSSIDDETIMQHFQSMRSRHGQL